MELKGFQKLKLEPGESRSLSFAIDRDTLSFHDAKGQTVVEAGVFELMVGTASDAIRLRGELTLVD